MSNTLYKQRSIKKQGRVYTTHISAMTEEKLQDKSDIAAELAHRDLVILQLYRALTKCRGQWIHSLNSNDCFDALDIAKRTVAGVLLSDT